ncbi:hypothetical protein RND81_10G081400 [Saponaria officinalis]|uniref:Uncharacterized protein n=1 Tax=Saponaria officinalis TaxID=3572 RepID=A0AAW1I259_SAPOF
MGENGREARRRRILQGGQDRLAIITGRKPNPDPSSPLLSDSQIEEDTSTYYASSRDQFTTKFSQDDALDGRSKEQPFVRKPEPSNEHMRAIPSVDRYEREPPSAAQKVIFIASDVILRAAKQIPISNVTSQQVSVAVAVTEHDRFLCSIAMAILVVLSYTGFPIIGSRMFRWFILFRPLFLLLITNITLIVRRLLPDNQKNLVRGDKDHNINASILGDGYAWAEEAGRALELGLMLQNVSGALFLDCSVYATILVFGLSLFG